MGLIDADKVKAIAREECKDCIMNGSVYCKRECFTNRVCDYIDNAPTVERPQGEWEDYSVDFWKCPECGYLLNKCCPRCYNKVILPKGGAE